MSIEILGLLMHRNVSEISPVGEPCFDLGMIQKLARSYDENGFDRVLMLQNSFAPDPFSIASYVSAITKRLSFMIAHRPGFIAPTMVARMFATLDQLSNGRAGIHIIAGANDKELECDGDFTTKEQRYLRSREFVEVLRTIWGSQSAQDYSGDFYKIRGALSETKPFRSTSIPIYWGGSSPLALEKGGECADVYAIGGLTSLDEMRKTVDDIKASAHKAGRTIRIQTSARIILGNTEEEAWRKADDILDRLREVGDEHKRQLQKDSNASTPGMRLDKKLSTTRGASGLGLIEAIAKGPSVIDDRLWTGITKASLELSTPAMPPALVGTAEQVTDSLLEYYAMGITGFLIRGFDLLEDISVFGETLIPLLRSKTAIA